MDIFISLVIALILDQILGEPKRYHPLIQFGRFVSWVENHLYLSSGLSAQQMKIRGVIAIVIVIAPVTGLSLLLLQLPFLNTILPSLMLYFCIAAKSLKQHALSVYDGLLSDDLCAARAKVAMMVSRETGQMDRLAVRKAAIESVLENGADAVFAPIFWFLLAGPAGAVLYRSSNTLDAMWGYKNSHYLYFGWAAARFDDLLNWLPARLTAFSYALLGNSRQAFFCWRKQAPGCDSPNAGPVMAAGAGTLNLLLGGTSIYHGKIKHKPILGIGRQPVNQDIKRVNQLISNTILLWLAVLIVGNYIA